MARDLDVTYAAGLAAGTIMPIRLVMLTFKTATKYVWSGVGSLVWNGNTFVGVGSLGQVGTIIESTGVEANGTTVSLSGIDPSLLAECLSDIQLGAPARIWRGLWKDGAIYGTPYQVFRGYVDKPAFDISAETLAISLSLESRIVNLSRASYRRYTAADQHLQYPADKGFNWIEEIQDIALKTGT
jgi:hypothetical protein